MVRLSLQRNHWLVDTRFTRRPHISVGHLCVSAVPALIVSSVWWLYMVTWGQPRAIQMGKCGGYCMCMCTHRYVSICILYIYIQIQLHAPTHKIVVVYVPKKMGRSIKPTICVIQSCKVGDKMIINHLHSSSVEWFSSVLERRFLQRVTTIPIWWLVPRTIDFWQQKRWFPQVLALA